MLLGEDAPIDPDFILARKEEKRREKAYRKKQAQRSQRRKRAEEHQEEEEEPEGREDTGYRSLPSDVEDEPEEEVDRGPPASSIFRRTVSKAQNEGARVTQRQIRKLIDDEAASRKEEVSESEESEDDDMDQWLAKDEEVPGTDDSYHPTTQEFMDDDDEDDSDDEVAEEEEDEDPVARTPPVDIPPPVTRSKKKKATKPPPESSRDDDEEPPASQLLRKRPHNEIEEDVDKEMEDAQPRRSAKRRKQQEEDAPAITEFFFSDESSSSSSESDDESDDEESTNHLELASSHGWRVASPEAQGATRQIIILFTNTALDVLLKSEMLTGDARPLYEALLDEVSRRLSASKRTCWLVRAGREMIAGSTNISSLFQQMAVDAEKKLGKDGAGEPATSLFVQLYKKTNSNRWHTFCIDRMIDGTTGDATRALRRLVNSLKKNANDIKFLFHRSEDSNIQESDLVIRLANEVFVARGDVPADTIQRVLSNVILRGDDETLFRSEYYWLMFINEVLDQCSLTQTTTNVLALYVVLDIASLIHGPYNVATMLYQLCLRRKALCKQTFTRMHHGENQERSLTLAGAASQSIVQMALYLGRFLEYAERLMMQLVLRGRTMRADGLAHHPSHGVVKFLTYESTQKVFFTPPAERAIVPTFKVSDKRMNIVWGEIEAM
ncbi:MAG: hypothetical protein CMI02_10575 [Oceanospirillaceae bacterium]|nr:hypothetical protein [Oceanospirillaceae bacterium]